jgi:uncharacterized protein
VQYAEDVSATDTAAGADVPTLESLRARRDEILRIAAKHGARNVRVFGSVAAGYANARSDIDFLVDLEAGRDVFTVHELAEELEQVLGRKVDVLETPRRRTRAATQIRREAIAL